MCLPAAMTTSSWAWPQPRPPRVWPARWRASSAHLRRHGRHLPAYHTVQRTTNRSSVNATRHAVVQLSNATSTMAELTREHLGNALLQLLARRRVRHPCHEQVVLVSICAAHHCDSSRQALPHPFDRRDPVGKYRWRHDRTPTACALASLAQGFDRNRLQRFGAELVCATPHAIACE